MGNNEDRTRRQLLESDREMAEGRNARNCSIHDLKMTQRSIPSLIRGGKMREEKRKESTVFFHILTILFRIE